MTCTITHQLFLTMPKFFDEWLMAYDKALDYLTTHHRGHNAWFLFAFRLNAEVKTMKLNIELYLYTLQALLDILKQNEQHPLVAVAGVAGTLEEKSTQFEEQMCKSITAQSDVIKWFREEILAGGATVEDSDVDLTAKLSVGLVSVEANIIKWFASMWEAIKTAKAELKDERAIYDAIEKAIFDFVAKVDTLGDRYLEFVRPALASARHLAAAGRAAPSIATIDPTSAAGHLLRLLDKHATSIASVHESLVLVDTHQLSSVNHCKSEAIFC